MTTFLLRVALLVLWVFLAACAAWYMAGRSVERQQAARVFRALR